MIIDKNKFLLTPMTLLWNRNQEYDFCLYISNNMQGYFLEFGVWEGKSINYMAKKKPNITFYGFDSFEGLPEDWDMGNKIEKKGHFKVNKLPDVEKNVILIKGWFDETINNWKQKYSGPIQFINIDADLYSSTKTILYELNNQIIKNTIIRFDDLLDSPIAPYPKWQEGEWRALCEWCKEKDRVVMPISRSWKQGCTIVVKK